MNLTISDNYIPDIFTLVMIIRSMIMYYITAVLEILCTHADVSDCLGNTFGI